MNLISYTQYWYSTTEVMQVCSLDPEKHPQIYDLSALFFYERSLWIGTHGTNPLFVKREKLELKFLEFRRLTLSVIWPKDCNFVEPKVETLNAADIFIIWFSFIGKFQFNLTDYIRVQNQLKSGHEECYIVSKK